MAIKLYNYGSPQQPTSDSGSSRLKPFQYEKPRDIAPTTKKGAMVFEVGANMTPEQTAKAREVLTKPVIPVGQTIKVPFLQKGITVQSGDSIGGAYSAFKALIEFPEKATRTLTTDFGKSRQTENKQWRVPSYSEDSSKTVGQLIDDGVPPTAAIILGSAVSGGQFANDALIFDQVLGSTFRNLAIRSATPEAQTLAYDFLGRPKTLAQAETNFKNLQKQFHPDLSGNTGVKMSTEANNAIAILRKEGIPNKNILQRGIDTVFNKPLSSFRKVNNPVVETTQPSVLLPERTRIKPYEAPTTAPTTLKTAPETTIKSEVNTSPKYEKAPKEIITVNDKQFIVSPEKYDEFVKIEKLYKDRVKSYRDILAKNISVSQREYYTKQLKAEGMKFSAEKRRLTGDYTTTEIKNLVKQEQSNYIGKKVQVENNGKVLSGTIDSAPSFGRFKVKLEDGSIKSFFAKEIKDPRTFKQIQNEITKGKKEYTPKEIPQTTTKPKVKTSTTETSKDTPVETPTAGAPKPIENKVDTQLSSRVFERMKAENPSLEGELGYDPIKLKEDADKAVELLATDKQKAYRIAMGAETSPSITSTSVNIAMAEQALKEGNNELYAKLITNRSLEQTRRGQEIVAERGSITDNSTAKYVKELLATRLENVGKGYLSDVKNVVKKTTNKGKATKVVADEVSKLEKKIKNKKLDVNDALKLLDEIACI